MTNAELITLLIERAKGYLPDALASIARNDHMHALQSDQLPSAEQTAAVLTDFINYIGSRQGMDVGLYAVDIARPLIKAKS